MEKVQKTYTAEFKREAVRLAQISGKPIAQVAREWAFPIRPSTSGARSWPSMARKRFQEAGIRRLWRRKTAVSSVS